MCIDRKDNICNFLLFFYTQSCEPLLSFALPSFVPLYIRLIRRIRLIRLICLIRTLHPTYQTIFKVDPRMDQVALRILEGDAKAVVLFKELPMTDQVGACVYVCVCVPSSLSFRTLFRSSECLSIPLLTLFFSLIPSLTR